MTADLDDIPLETTTSEPVEQDWGLELYYPAGGPTVQTLDITIYYWCIDAA
jgi:hypothetical protein